MTKVAVENRRRNFSIHKGDTVIVVSGGHKVKRPIKGKVGKILSFTGRNGDRVVVEGVNFRTFTQKPKQAGAKPTRVQREASMHVSNVMFYVEKIKKGVRIKHKTLTDGKKVRGYLDPKSKEFVELKN